MQQRILFSDLDGTLISGGQSMSADNQRTLRQLKAAGIITVLATGRNLYSLKKVVCSESHWDFIIFSTGVGILDWTDEKILFHSELSAKQVAEISSFLYSEQIDTMIQAPVPENHHFYYRAFSTPENCQSDFFRRVEIYRNYSIALPAGSSVHTRASQLLAILAPGDPRLSVLNEGLSAFSVVRATSPLDGKSIWLEIFAPGVNKARAADWLLEYCNKSARTYALGNDHNDYDLLNWAENSLIAADSPEELKEKFKILPIKPEVFLSAAAKHWQLLPKID